MLNILQSSILSGSRAYQKDAILVIGDSIAAGLSTHADSTLPQTGKALEYDRNTSTIINFGDGAGITGFSYNAKSPWAKFCIDYFNLTGRIPVVINRAAASSTISPATTTLIGNDWQTSGTNYTASVAAANDCLAKLNKTKLTFIMINLGINDVQGQSGTGSLTVAQVSTYYDTLISNLQADFGTDVPILTCIPGSTASIIINSRLTGIRNVIKQKAVSTTNVFIAASLTSFLVNSLYESDQIHPTATGNDYMGSMFSKWYANGQYSKWARTLICCQFDDPPLAFKTKIQDFITGFETEYLGMDLFYNFKTSLKLNANFDWALLNGPESDGGYTFTANSDIRTNGSSTTFQCGYNQNATRINAVQNDYAFEVYMSQVNTGSGVTAGPFGTISTGPTRTSVLRQLNTLGINWANNSLTSFTYAGENSFGVGSYFNVRTSSTANNLYKNGTSVDSRTDTSGSFSAGNWAVGVSLLNAAPTSYIDAKFTRAIIMKATAIANMSSFVTALNTLQS
jgi:lysophospholipase L1-like esterase